MNNLNLLESEVGDDVSYFFKMAGFLEVAMVKKDTRGPFTRYFSFTRISPNDGDLEMLVDVCFRIKAYLCYKFNKLDGRLEGFMVLHGPRAYVDDLCRLFPNFLLQPLKPDVYIRLVEGHDFTVVGEHPFDEVRKVLFPVFNKRVFDEEEDVIAGAVGAV